MINEFNDDFELVTADAVEDAEEANLLIERTESRHSGYYVLFKKSSGNIVSINRSVNKYIEKDELEMFLESSDELDAVFFNKMNVDKIKVKYDIAKKTYILVVSKDFGGLFVHEFILVDIQSIDNYIIDIKFNLVNKNVYFKLNYKKLAFYLSTQTPEYVLELSNGDIVFYLFDKQNPTMLYDRYTIKLQDLIEKEYITFKADWMELMRHNEFRVLTSNVGIEASIVIDDQYVKDHLDYEKIQTDEYPETPMLRLTVTDGQLIIESMISDPVNYKLAEQVNLYLHKEGEPESLLRKYVINRSDLANHNKFILDTAVLNERITAVCDPRYLNVETIYE